VRIVGATATPRGGSGKYGLKSVFEEVAYRLPIDEAIEQGALVPFKSLAIDVPTSFSAVERKGTDYDSAQAGAAMDIDPVHAAIVEAWKKNAAGRPTLAFAHLVTQAERLAEAFRKSGISALCVHAGTPPDVRKQVKVGLESGEILVLTNVGIYGEGVDIPCVSCMVQARPTTSDSVYVQMLGRVLRTFENKADALVLDFRPSDARDLFMAGDLLSGEPGWDARHERLHWLKQNNYLVTQVGKDYCAAAVRVEGVYHVLRVCTKRGSEGSTLLGSASDWNEVQKYVDMAGGFDWWIASKDAKWKVAPASEGQMWYLRRRGLWEVGMTKGQASLAISAARAAEIILKYPVDESRPMALDDTRRNFADTLRFQLAAARRKARFAIRKEEEDK
jgi:hypothetical protein